MSRQPDLLAMEIPPLREGLRTRIEGSLQILLGDIERVKYAGANRTQPRSSPRRRSPFLEEGDYPNAAWRLRSAQESFEAPARLTSSGSSIAVVDTPGPSWFSWLAGPDAVAVLFVGVSAILLPAVEIFLVRSFHLDTAIILALGYSWAGLSLYTLVSAALLHKGSTEKQS